MVSQSVGLRLGQHSAALLGVVRLEGRQCPDVVTSDHEQDKKAESEDAEEGHHAIDPADANCSLPGVDVEVDRQAQE